jgi:hypothetical protein
MSMRFGKPVGGRYLEDLKERGSRKDELDEHRKEGTTRRHRLPMHHDHGDGDEGRFAIVNAFR